MAYTRFPADGPAADRRATQREKTVPREFGSRERRERGNGRAARTSTDATALNPVVTAFLISLFIPLIFSVGGLALDASRVVILLCLLPVTGLFLSGRGGQMRAEDMLLFAYVGWISIAFFVYGGFGQIEFIGISIAEMITPYLLARCFIRTEAQYTAMIRLVVAIIAVMACAAAVESVTGFRVFNRIFDVIGQTHSGIGASYEQRLGLTRAGTVFQHPILYGVAMSLFFAIAIHTPRAADPKKTGGARNGIIVGAATFFSLSTGAWLSLIVQIGLLMWDRIFIAFKARWKTFMWLAAAGYVTIDLLSNRTPFEVFVSYATLNSGTGYMRILIFIYGMDNVWANPIFGLGLGNWVRPGWMHASSVDNFWLLQAMRTGIPAFLLIALTYGLVLYRLARRRMPNERLRLQRNAYVYGLAGVALALCTVHVWGPVLYLLVFMLGAASWMHTLPDTSDQDPEMRPGRDRSPRHTQRRTASRF